MKSFSALAVTSSLLSAIVLIPCVAHASGFALNEESASVLGTAFAGAAVSNEPAVMFTNPAGIAGLKGDQAQMGGTLYRIDGSNFQNQGTRTLLGTAATGNSTSVGQTVEAAFMYYTHQINNDLTFGLGIYSPFGLVTAYDPTWVGRYTAIESHVNTTEISPVLAYKVTNDLSVGFGPTLRYTEAKLTQAIDFGSIGVASSIGGAVSQGMDGQGKLEGDGIGYGFKFGLNYNLTPDTKIGLGYRSRMTTRLKGQSHYSLSAMGQALSGATGAFVNTDAHTDLNTPQSFNVSVSHHLTDPLTLYGDFLWTGWSTFQQLEISYANTHQPTTVIAEKWRDTMRFSVGASYDLTPKWTLRTGYSYDQTPVESATYTTARIPDGDRHWVAIGAGYKVMDGLRVDVAYDHLFMVGGSSNNAVASAGTLVGSWGDMSADLFTLNATYSF